MNVGDNVELEILRVTDEGKGVAFNQEGKMILIEGITEDDELINAQITEVFEESYFAEKIGSKQQRQKDMQDGLVDSPYDLDDGEEDEE